MGEPEKWVPVSPQRVTSIRWDQDDVTVHLKGAAQEKVNFAFTLGGLRGKYTCELSETGTTAISFHRQGCLST